MNYDQLEKGLGRKQPWLTITWEELRKTTKIG
jgi:hypothetical protein